MEFTDALILLFWLLFGHSLADYPLQGNFLSWAKRKNRPEGADHFWILALATHGCIHAGFVAAFTGSYWLAAFEFVTHIIIDYNKCAGRYGMKTDQALHVLCKILWVLLFAWGW